MRFILITLLGVSLNIAGYAQLIIDTTDSPNILVEKVLLGNSAEIITNDVIYTGYKSSIGKYSCSMKYNKLPTHGIILSTGNVYDAIGPNDLPNKSSRSSGISFPNIENIAKGNTSDASILEIKFTATTDSISIGFFFASEEYPEYANKNVNDAFAFYLIDVEFGTSQNLAVLPSSNIPISIDNINSITNKEYYIENGIWDKNNIQKWSTQKQLGELAYTFQFDGMSTLQYLGGKIIPNHMYLLRIIIVDVGDRLYDSAIFLEANSFKTVNTKSSIQSSNSNRLIANHFPETKIIETDEGSKISFNIEFESDSDQITGNKSFMFLDKVFDLLSNNPNMKLQVYGHTDSNGTIEYNQRLSDNRAINVSQYLIKKGIKTNRINTKGLGQSHLVSTDNHKLNRRVEFVFVNN